MPDIKLVCFDLDLTLVNEHYDARLREDGIVSYFKVPIAPIVMLDGEFLARLFTEEECDLYNKKLIPTSYKKEEIVAHVDELLNNEKTGVKNPELIKKLFEKLLELNIAIAITTFSDYHEVAPLVLRRIGLSDEVVKEIPIICRYSINKNRHIEKAMKYFGVSDGDKVLLVDDDHNNIIRAADKNFNTVWVSEDSTEYINDIYNLILRGEVQVIGGARAVEEKFNEDWELFSS